METTPQKFQNPHSLSNKIARVAWGFVWATLFRTSPWFMRGWRRMLVRLFGGKVGNVDFHPTVEIWAPWLLEAGDLVFIARDVILYNTYRIKIGSRVTISRGAFLCTPSHDHTYADCPLIGGQITVGNDTWIAAEAFISPGVTVGEGAVVGARAMVTKEVHPWTVVVGNPAHVLKPRELKPPADRH
jgi:putative colanic acid biosynthesis acetyltransferase WcaF